MTADITFHPAPGWPTAPEGWLPPSTWSPGRDWVAAPDDWVFYRGPYGTPVEPPPGFWKPFASQPAFVSPSPVPDPPGAEADEPESLHRKILRLSLIGIGAIGIIVFLNNTFFPSTETDGFLEVETDGFLEVKTTVGKPAIIDSAEYTLNSVECGIYQQIGPYYPTGQWCLMDVTIRNVGTSGELFVASDDLKLIDDKNVQYDNDSASWRLEQYHGNVTLNPGLQTTTQLLFDVPEDSNITKAYIGHHDVWNEKGVMVSLG